MSFVEEALFAKKKFTAVLLFLPWIVAPSYCGDGGQTILLLPVLPRPVLLHAEVLQSLSPLVFNVFSLNLPMSPRGHVSCLHRKSEV